MFLSLYCSKTTKGLQMGKKFNHLTWTQRLQLESYLKVKMSKKEIANKLGVHISTVYREVKRGVYDRLDGNTWITYKAYSPDIAEENYRKALSCKGASIKIGKDFALVDYIEKRIVEDKLSPQAVLGEIKHKGLQFDTTICTTTLYSYIAKGVFLTLDLSYLPNVKMKRKRHVHAKRPPRGTSIEKRPDEVRRRNTFGHWEMDCVCGGTKPTLLVLTERLTRKEIIYLMPNQKAESVIYCLNRLERHYGKLFRKIFKTITVDNGSEFADFHGLEKSSYGRNKRRTSVYYCHPYCSCERGSNERLNREIRRQLPKGTNFANFTAEEIQKVEDWVNNYPRKIFDFATSQELFDLQLSQIA